MKKLPIVACFHLKVSQLGNTVLSVIACYINCRRLTFYGASIFVSHDLKIAQFTFLWIHFIGISNIAKPKY